MGPPQAGIWGLVVARTLCSLRDVEATVHAHILSTGITNSAWQGGTGTRCPGTQVKYAHARTQGNRGHPSHSRLHGEQRTRVLRGHWQVQHRKSATVISEGTGVVRISLVPRLSKPGGTRLPRQAMCTERLCWLPCDTEGPSWQVDGGGRNRWLKWGLGIWLV